VPVPQGEDEASVYSVFQNILLYGMPVAITLRPMIQGFADETTRALWHRRPVRRIPVGLQDQAFKRLSYLNAAARIEDLYQPPSNHFHSVGKRFAIRVNRQWRISFLWTSTGPSDVRFEDYH